MPEFAGEKTLDPTPHRRQQARREGHVAKSHELSSTGTLMVGLAALALLGGGLAGFLADFCRQQLSGPPWLSADANFVADQWNAALWAVGRWTLPILGLVCAGAAAVHLLQSGFLFLPQRLAPDLSRLDPMLGIRRMFSTAGAVRLALGLAKSAILLVAVAAVLYSQCDALLALSGLAPGPMAAQMGHILIWTAIKLGGVLLVLALADYAYQWHRHEQELKMTPQELREELRNLEGDPRIAARRKQLRREWTGKPPAFEVPVDFGLRPPAPLAKIKGNP